MPELRRHHEAPEQRTRGATDRAETAVGLGGSGRAGGCRHRCHRRRSGRRDRAAGSHISDGYRSTRRPPAPARRRRPAQRARFRRAAHPTIYCAPAPPAATAPHRNWWRPWPRICSTRWPEPTSTTSSAVCTPTAPACTSMHREPRTGTGAGRAPAAIRRKSKPSAPASAPRPVSAPAGNQLGADKIERSRLNFGGLMAEAKSVPV